MPWRLMAVLIRTDGDAGTPAPAVRRDSSPGWYASRLRRQTAREPASESNWHRRVYGEVFGSFALMVLLLPVFGVYSVMAYAFNQRTHEIGGRVALGARRYDVLQLAVGEGASIVRAGITFGLLAAVGLTGLIRSLLWGVEPVDPVVFDGIPLPLAGVALLASYLPARRATRVDPMVALRAE